MDNRNSSFSAPTGSAVENLSDGVRFGPLYDLHIHSDYSDGKLSIESIVDLAVSIGLSGISITDHDTVSGLTKAAELARKASLVFVPGIELNTDFEEEEVHILGYFFDPAHPLLNARLTELKIRREQRAGLIVERLCDLGCPLNMEEVKDLAGDDVIGRPHIARAMVKRGYVEREAMAFDLYIARGRPAFVPRYQFTPQEACDLIKKSGGIPFLAHPGKIRRRSVVEMTIEMGIMGLEVYYPEHTEEDIRYLLDLAEKRHLLISGGSDFHGPGSGENRETLGISGLSEDGFRRILEYFEGKPD